jgi:hypothetical protein
MDGLRPGLVFLFVLLVAACSGGEAGSSDDDGNGGNGATSGSGGSGASSSGTGLPSGTACVKVGASAEQCTASGNTVSRSLSDGNISISVGHLSAAAICQANCNTTRTCADPASFTLGFTMPDGLPFPYQKSGLQGQPGGSHGVNDGVCVFRDSMPYPIAGTVYQAGTQGATHVEADISFQTVGAVCLPSPNGCPNVTARIRFNLPL